MNGNWKKWMLHYFDLNGDGKVNWWECLIPFLIVLAIEVLAEILVRLMFQ